MLNKNDNNKTVDINYQNLELWLRLANDNKINYKNSWNVALIDYFHDLSLFKDSSNNINFQSVSTTLDGCIKVYSTRVDSAANETGKLLTNLSINNKSTTLNNNNDNGNLDNNLDDLDDPNNEYNTQIIRNLKAKNSKLNKPVNTLVNFAQIKLKKQDLELQIDPLFKSALANFDGGGAKSLFSNLLDIDKSQRLIIDSTNTNHLISNKNIYSDHNNHYNRHNDDNDDNDDNHNDNDENYQTFISQSKDMDFEYLKTFLPTSSQLNSFEVSHSIKYINNLTFMRNPGNNENSNNLQNENQNEIRKNFDELRKIQEKSLYDIIPIDNHNNSSNNINTDDIENVENDGEILLNRNIEINIDEITNNKITSKENGKSNLNIELLSYFDNIMQNNWVGPYEFDSWKVRNIKKMINWETFKNQNQDQNLNHDQQIQKKSRIKKKSEFLIDFFSENPENDNLFGDENINSELKTIENDNNEIDLNLYLPKNQWVSKTQNLLPDDRQYNGKKFTKLFLKDELINSYVFNKNIKKINKNGNKEIELNSRNTEKKQENVFEDEDAMDRVVADENFWASAYQNSAVGARNSNVDTNENVEINDQNFFGFGDDGIDDDQYEGLPNSISGSLNSNFISKKLKDKDRIKYSKIMKSMNVKLLKEDLWECLEDSLNNKDKSIENMGENNEHSRTYISSSGFLNKRQKLSLLTLLNEEHDLKFSSVMTKLYGKYAGSKDQTEISTSYCFICLLHLANEKGLEIENTDDYEDLLISTMD
ncbi:uncharacterized protein ASCRUDRAFT_69919 [Ascoidea rubescens DSM 1968]|uniref:Condensin complex subunit 2 n=1 Tax=Ascoidea rubescens DSM 1968 TaxID=1344418 RepID=A0A1D2VIV4_9ASCO|nr:hypothetical protein ASCRUDRAFT_69919 [Ascoidea rubescens DSM 1968]ODV61417.1 hypothetical protein ASCRUDRAFT_69919 [Ascoidea rubescens DSM 1968]